MFVVFVLGLVLFVFMSCCCCSEFLSSCFFRCTFLPTELDRIIFLRFAKAMVVVMYGVGVVGVVLRRVRVFVFVLLLVEEVRRSVVVVVVFGMVFVKDEEDIFFIEST